MQVRQIKHAVYFFIFCIICRFTYLILPRTIWLLKFLIVQKSLNSDCFEQSPGTHSEQPSEREILLSFTTNIHLYLDYR